MQTWSVYELATGRLTGARITMTSPQFVLLPDAVPEGCSLVLGEWDHTAWVVDDAGRVVPIIGDGDA